MCACSDKSGQPGAIGAGALDAKRSDRPKRLRSGLKCLIAFAVDRDIQGAETDTEAADGRGGMGELGYQCQ